MTKETHVYKEAGGCRIELDIHRPDVAADGKPAILWIHGGALIGGNRDAGKGRIGRYLDAGYTLFSIDYRLAPETKLPEIIADVRDACAWVRTQGADLTGIDPSRVGVVGHSAGGYLTLMAGTFEPAPAALVPFYGYGDIVGAWYSEPDPGYCKEPAVDEADARRHFSGPPVARPDQRPGQGPFYLYCRQQGIWPNEVAGRDPKTDPDFFVPYCPDRNVTDEYPPTLLLHGTSDHDVPYDLSVRMAASLADAGVEHDLVTIEGGGHGFEGGPGETDPAVQDAWRRVMAFLEAHV